MFDPLERWSRLLAAWHQCRARLWLGREQAAPPCGGGGAPRQSAAQLCSVRDRPLQWVTGTTERIETDGSKGGACSSCRSSERHSRLVQGCNY